MKNLRAVIPPDSEPPQQIQFYIDDDVQSDEMHKLHMPIIDPEDLVGKVLSVTQEDGETIRIKVIEAISDHLSTNSESVKFKCSVNNDSYEKSYPTIRSWSTWQKITMILCGNSKRS